MKAPQSSKNKNIKSIEGKENQNIKNKAEDSDMTVEIKKISLAKLKSSGKNVFQISS